MENAFICRCLPISIHALREESDVGEGPVEHADGISIHALREESDTFRVQLDKRLVISIHALREESDRHQGQGHPRLCDFNPRSP